MTADGLRSAREAAWRQDGRALITGEDAAGWLREAGLVLLRPRGKEVPAPGPSFVEAVGGASDAQPGLAAVEAAMRLVRRLAADGDAVPLLLLGGGAGGDAPDFLASVETFPYVYALRGDREWTRGPRGKSSPLELAAWELLGREGSLTATAIKDQLGKHLTETAALRAVTALWADLRVEPVYAENGETAWRRMEAERGPAMAAGSAMGQATALSGLVSVYLQSAVAAAGEEIEAFLGPLASRSRVRDAVRGLHAARQVGVRSLGPREHFYVEGSLGDMEERRESPPAAIPDLLPEIAAAEMVVEGEDGGKFRIEAIPESEAAPVGEGRKRFVAGRTGGPPRTPERKFGTKPSAPFAAREPWREDRNESRGGAGARGSFNPGARPRPFPRKDGDRPAFGENRGARKPFGTEAGKGAGPSGENRPERPRFGPGNPAGERPSGGFAPRDREREGERPYEKRAQSGDRKPFAPRAGGASADAERRPFRASNADGEERRPFKPGGFSGQKRDTQQGGSRPEFGGEKARYGGKEKAAGAGPTGSFGRKPFGGAGGGMDRPRRTFRDGEPPAARPAGKGGFSGGGRASEGAGNRFRADAGEGRQSFSPRGGASFSGGEKRPFRPRENGAPSDGETRPFRPREGNAPYGGGAQRTYGTPGRGGEGRPFRARQGGAAGGEAGNFRSENTGGYGGENRPPRPAGTGTSSSERKSFGGAKPAWGAKRDGADRPRREGDAPRQEGAPGTRFRPEGAGAERRSFGSGGGPRTGPPGGGFRAGGGAGAARPGGKKPRTAPFTSSGKPRTGVAKPGRPGSKASRKPFGTGAPKSGRDS